MPRVVFGAIAVVLAACLSPLVYTFGEHPLWVQVLVVALCLPVVLVIVASLMAALRPGSLGRLTRRLRARRAAD